MNGWYLQILHSLFLLFADLVFGDNDSDELTELKDSQEADFWRSTLDLVCLPCLVPTFATDTGLLAYVYTVLAVWGL